MHFSKVACLSVLYNQTFVVQILQQSQIPYLFLLPLQFAEAEYNWIQFHALRLPYQKKQVQKDSKHSQQ